LNCLPIRHGSLVSNEAHWTPVLNRRPPRSAALTQRVLRSGRTLIVVCRFVRAIILLVVSAVIFSVDVLVVFSVDVLVVAAGIQARLAFHDFVHG